MLTQDFTVEFFKYIYFENRPFANKVKSMVLSQSGELLLGEQILRVEFNE
jgi:hypothetical protein